MLVLLVLLANLLSLFLGQLERLRWRRWFIDWRLDRHGVDDSRVDLGCE